MKRPFLSIAILSIFLFYAHLLGNAQQPGGTIKGKILTDDKPAVSITIALQKLGGPVFSDNNGFFIINHLPELRDTLIISSAETKTYKRAINLGKNETIDLGIIHLNNKIPQLPNIEITGRTADSYKSDYSFFVNKTQTPLIDIPQSVSTVTKELIMDKMDFSLKDIVDGIAGVNQYSGYDEYTIRGFRAENAREINGLRGYNTTYTSSLLVNIERVEIIKGPVSTLYGNGDPGGTINLVTKKPLAKRETEINIYGGSWNHFRILGDKTGPLNKRKTLLYRFNAGYDKRQSFRNQYFEKSYEVAPSLSFIPNEKLSFNLDITFSHINSVLDRGQPGFLNDTTLHSTSIKLSLSHPGDYLRENDIASIASISYKMNGHVSYNLGVLNYITQQDVANHGLKNYITQDSVNLYFTQWKYRTVTNTISNNLNFKFQTGKIIHQLIMGYDYIRSKVNLHQQNYEFANLFGQGSGIAGTFSLKNPVYFISAAGDLQPSDFNSNETEIDGNVYHTQGLYFQDHISIKKWQILLGLREEFYKGEISDSSLKENVFLPRVGLVYAFRNKMNAYATFNKGFDPFEASNSNQIFKPPFRPQISYLMELGAKGNFFSNKLSASIAFYQLILQNVAVNANDISNPNLFLQQGEERSKGVELEASGKILSNLSVDLSYAYCLSKITKSTVPAQIGNTLENAPKHISGSWIKYSFNKGLLNGFGISVGHSQTGVRNTLVANLLLPGYLILNAGIHYNFKHFGLAINLKNITNKTYWVGAYNNVSKWPGEPRNYLINLRYKL